MTDRQDREEESRATEDSRYDRELETEQERRHEVAERLGEPPEPRDDD